MENGSRIRRQINFANVTALLALFIALGGTVYAAATIGASDIKRNAVRAKHIKANNVKRPDIAANAVNAAKIAGNAVGSSEVAGNAVGTSELQNASVTAAKLNTPAQWIDVPYGPGWATFVGTAPTNVSFGPLQCYKDPFGIVHLRGAAENVSGGNTVAILPPACRVIPEDANPADNQYAEFLSVRLNDFGTGQLGGEPLYVGLTGSDQNSIGLDQAAPPVNEGLTFDGVAIGAR